MEKNFVIAVDIGSPRHTRNAPLGKLGWYSFDGVNHKSGSATDFREQIEEKDYCAIGIEAPLFLPVTSFQDFTSARNFDANRSWSAGPGACVTAINLPFLVLCLRSVKNRDIEITTDYAYWKAKKAKCILFWEAFISGQSEGDIELEELHNPHIRDAELACKMFFVEKHRTVIELSQSNLISLPEIFSLSEGLTFVKTTNGLLVKSGKR